MERLLKFHEGVRAVCESAESREKVAGFLTIAFKSMEENNHYFFVFKSKRNVCWNFMSEIRLRIRREQRESGRKLEEPNFWKNLFSPQNRRKHKITFISKKKRRRKIKLLEKYFLHRESELSRSSVSKIFKIWQNYMIRIRSKKEVSPILGQIPILRLSSSLSLSFKNCCWGKFRFHGGVPSGKEASAALSNLSNCQLQISQFALYLLYFSLYLL